MSFAIFLAFFSSLFVNPILAHAGFFDFVGKVFASDTAPQIDPASGSVDSASANSQNLPLLKSLISADLSASASDSDVSITGDALASAGVSSLGNTVVDPDSDFSEDGPTLYVVNSDDTISNIAKMFDLSESTIISTNDLKKGQKLSPGQILFIMPTNGVQVIVKKGDTVQGLAKKYSAEAKEIAIFNGLSDGTQLAVGDSLFVPNGVMKESPSSAPSKPKSSLKKVFGNAGPVLEGYFTRPIAAGVGRKTQKIHDHNAVDWGAPTGTPIMAIADGVVSASVYQSGRVWNGGWGNMVVIKHDKDGVDRGKATKVHSLYAHMSKVYVKSGEFVKQGQVIGLVGSTGRSTGPHLHLEIWGAHNFLVDL